MFKIDAVQVARRPDHFGLSPIVCRSSREKGKYLMCDKQSKRWRYFVCFKWQQRKITKKLKKTDETEKQPVEQLDIQDAIDVLVDDEVALRDNLCAKKHCGAGKECRVNENGVAECLCMDHCPEEKDPRRMVYIQLSLQNRGENILNNDEYLSDLQQSEWNLEFRLWTLSYALPM